MVYEILFFLEVETFDEGIVMQLILLITNLGRTGRWPGGRPRYIDDTDELGIRTAGGHFPLAPPWTAPTAKRLAQEAVVLRRTIDELQVFADRTGAPIGVELGGEYIGEIRAGTLPTRLMRFLGLA